MPELPDLAVYMDALNRSVRGQVLHGVRLRNPFVLRTADPPLDAVAGRTVTGVRRQGKRIVLELAGDLFLVVHLMIAGRLRWLEPGRTAPARITLALFDFAGGTLALTEAGTRRRASLHVIRGAATLAALDSGGLEIGHVDAKTFAARLRAENHTLKRALTDPHIVSGIGNAYSDEILHRAKLSPIAQTAKLDDDAMARLYSAATVVLDEWTQRLRAETGERFPEKVTAFRPAMAVHGKFRQPCPVCGTAVQRIVYAENECNYCPRCQTNGVVLADRALSRLLHKSFRREI
ncbi:MAG TPA: DNA-formamidopyrimidine glycosylase family protein [Casimicrobiaceae bacterium]|nr:DNA-formamidopyrimidine glycosylase family protein [Casimicrobiaceae bacterium]